MVDGKHALVVVACVAGFGAAGGVFVQEAGDAPTYASELFGTGSDALVVQYPTCKDAATGTGSPRATCDTDGTPGVDLTEGASEVVLSKPWVKLHFSNDNTIGEVKFAGDDAVNDTALGADGTTGEVTFALTNAAFGETVASDNLTGFGTISVVNGGNKGDTEVTFGVAFTGEATDDAALTFVLPRLTALSKLGSDKVNAVHVSVTTRGVGGAGFPTGGVGFHYCPVTSGPEGSQTTADVCDEENPMTLGRAVTVAKDAPAVTFSSTAHPTANIDIDNRSMLADKATQAAVATLSLTVTQAVNATTPILQADGSIVDNDVRGVLDVDASGTMQLFGGDDGLYVDYNGNKKQDLGEALTVEGDAASFNGGGLSIDPDDKGNAARDMIVYYVPGGKDDLAHGSMIHVMAAVNFTPATAADKMAKTTATELRFKGVRGELKAYAIPFDGNGKGDMANVRVRCEDGVMNKDGDSMCRVFLECWSDMGMRSFGESDMVYEGAVDVLNAAEIEAAVGIEEGMATSRHSCRVLATGMPSVQTLVRDGSSGTLVNNTYVSE